jgi:hypothetical protein
MHEVSLVRLYLLRILYFLIAFVMGSEQWRIVIERAPETPMMQGVAHSMLAALALVCVLGLRYPLQMLPLLFFEFAWKAIWLIGVALRLQLHGRLPESYLETVIACSIAITIPIIMPWRHVVDVYLRKPGDRWF